MVWIGTSLGCVSDKRQGGGQWWKETFLSTEWLRRDLSTRMGIRIECPEGLGKLCWLLLVGVLARWDNAGVLFLGLQSSKIPKPYSLLLLTSWVRAGEGGGDLQDHSLTPTAILRVPKTTLRYYNLLEGLIELRKVIILTVKVYYREGIQIKISQGDTQDNV